MSKGWSCFRAAHFILRQKSMFTDNNLETLAETLAPSAPMSVKPRILSTCVESHHQTIKMFRPTQASPLRLLKKDGINTCLTVGGERGQPWLHILGNSMQKALMLTSSPIFTGPSKNKQKNLIQSQINQCMLCLWEKYFILHEPWDASLNKRTEIFGFCRHKDCWLLVNN